MWWEVKTERGTPTIEQREWLNALEATGMEARIVRPRDWTHVIDTLRRGPR